ncbi:MAG: class I SAM-dependent methyltransferase [Armatimonadota bacterium]|nr:class I SAM-dependent methyltransferase [Armatimonadota bacterium]
MQAVERCPLCESDSGSTAKLLFRSVDYISQEVFDVLQCGECGMAYTGSVPDQESEFGRYYPQEDYYGSESGERFGSPVERMILAFRRGRAKKVIGARKTGSVLDVGCGRGLFLRLLKSLGWQCCGTELSETLVSSLMGCGIDVRRSSVLECGFPDNTFDVVTIYHALEHLSNPLETLREVRRVIKEDGLLIIGAPNIASVQSRLSGSRWFHLDVPRHTVHFSRETLASIAERCGFEIVASRSFSAEYDPYGLLQSILNVLRCRRNFLYQLLRRQRVVRSDVRTLLYDLPLSLLFPILLVLPCFVAEMLLSLFGLNGTQEIRCRPSVS